MKSRSQWPSSLRRGSTAARLLGFRVRIPPGEWVFVPCECCVLSGRGLCDWTIPRPEESYRLCCVIVCDLETSQMRRPWPTLGCCVRREGGEVQNKNVTAGHICNFMEINNEEAKVEKVRRLNYLVTYISDWLSQWPSGLRRGSAVDRLLGLPVRVLLGYGYLSLVSVVCLQMEVSATGRSLV